jgi:hypothetical protein
VSDALGCGNHVFFVSELLKILNYLIVNSCVHSTFFTQARVRWRFSLQPSHLPLLTAIGLVLHFLNNRYQFDMSFEGSFLWGSLGLEIEFPPAPLVRYVADDSSSTVRLRFPQLCIYFRYPSYCWFSIHLPGSFTYYPTPGTFNIFPRGSWAYFLYFIKGSICKW